MCAEIFSQTQKNSSFTVAQPGNWHRLSFVKSLFWSLPARSVLARSYRAASPLKPSPYLGRIVWKRVLLNEYICCARVWKKCARPRNRSVVLLRTAYILFTLVQSRHHLYGCLYLQYVRAFVFIEKMN